MPIIAERYYEIGNGEAGRAVHDHYGGPAPSVPKYRKEIVAGRLETVLILGRRAVKGHELKRHHERYMLPQAAS